jgi:hypothetical protein
MMWYRPVVRRIPIGLTDSQHLRLAHEAARRRVSVAALVREAVDATFPEELEARRAARLRSLQVIGMFDSGRSDISERHDELLGEVPW